MSDTAQRRALRNYRSRLNKRGVATFEVQGLETDRELTRTLARRPAEGGPASDASTIICSDDVQN